MAKTRAEIQKAYRERRKRKEGEKYLKKECDRVMKYCTPARELGKSELKKRNEANKARNRVSRLKKKVSSAPENTKSSNLIVKLPALSKNAQHKKSKALSHALLQIKKLKAQNKTLKQKYKTELKRRKRARKREIDQAVLTPTKKTKQIGRAHV